MILRLVLGRLRENHPIAVGESSDTIESYLSFREELSMLSEVMPAAIEIFSVRALYADGIEGMKWSLKYFSVPLS